MICGPDHFYRLQILPNPFENLLTYHRHSLGRSGGDQCHRVCLVNGNLHYFSDTQPYWCPVWNNFYTHIYIHTHWSVKQMNKMHILYVFHVRSLKHGNLELKNSFSTMKLCPNSQVIFPVPSSAERWGVPTEKNNNQTGLQDVIIAPSICKYL